MKITARRIQILILLFSLVFIVWGTLLPWECTYNIGHVCIPGLGLYEIGIANIGGTQIILIIVTILTLCFLLYASKVFKRSSMGFGLAIVLGTLLFLGSELGVIINSGGLQFVLAALTTIWIALDTKWRATAVTVGFACIVVIFATYNLLEVFLPTSSEFHFGTLEWQGRLLLLLGSLWMLGAVLFGKYVLNRAITPFGLQSSLEE